MTLSERNAFFKTGIAFCAICTLLILAASFLVFPVYEVMGENTRRPADFFQVFVSNFLDADYVAVHVSLILSVLFSLVGIILIYSFFEQTSSPEILYIAFFTISFSFEVIRLILPLQFIYGIPSPYILIASRVLLFARYFSVFSLFTAGVCATGLEVQKTSTIIIVVIISTLVCTFSVPIDIQTWDTSLNVLCGYISMFRLIEAIAFFSTVISFFAAVNIRGSKEYIRIGFGVIFALIGRNMLLGADNWAASAAGIVLLSIGIWFVCSKLHKIYLWL
jgi:hypothetical protein